MFPLKAKLNPSVFSYTECELGALVDLPRSLAYIALDALDFIARKEDLVSANAFDKV